MPQLSINVKTNTKTCSECKQEKPVNEFSFRNTIGWLDSRCKLCNNIRGKEIYRRNPQKHITRAVQWGRDNPEKKKENDRKYRIKHPEVGRNISFIHRYGITLKEYQNLLEIQNHICAICDSDGKGRPLFVDHDHITGRVRGLLCKHCNSAIGLFQDDIHLMKEAIKYLEHSHE